MLKAPPTLLAPSSSSARAWGSLALSLILHGLLLGFWLGPGREHASELESEQLGAPERRRVELVYLSPAPPPKPPIPAARPPRETSPGPLPEPRSQAPPVRQVRPEPEPNAPPEAPRTEGAEPERDETAGPTQPAHEVETATMESEARRIFGRPRLGPRPGAGPLASRPMEAYVHDRPDKCVPRPQPPRDSAGPPQLGTALGRIFRQDDGRPLPGAFLQMIGTPFVAFTDENGGYRFRFDLSLIDNCRTQYVRVSAPGYRSRLLVLVVGENIRSEDVSLRRR